MANQNNSIPIVNIEDLLSQKDISREDDKWLGVATELGKALHDYGFAYLKNHGIPKQTIDEAFEESKKFFELPMDVKIKYAKTSVVDNYHGYNVPGAELLDLKSVELREAYDVYGQRRFYPEKEVPAFQEKLESLESACIELDQKILKLLAISLGLEDINFFCTHSPQLFDRTSPGLDTLRTLYYPPVNDGDTAGLVRCAEHTDYGTLTLLFQDDEGGLHVKSGDSDWIKAQPVPDTIVVNIGDLLEHWTDGYFPATLHKVMIPEDESRKLRIRQSIAYFIHPGNDVIVEPMKIPGFPGNKSRLKGPTSAVEHITNKMKASYGISLSDTFSGPLQ